MLPIGKDAIDGPRVALDLALVEARVGEADAAVQHVQQLLAIPGILSPGMLRVDPRWGPLHSDPRFRQLAGLNR